MFLTFLTFLPLIGALALAFIPKEKEGMIKQTALAVAVADFLLSLQLYADFDTTTAAMQFTLDIPWIDAWGISYHVGIDGISLLLYIMTTMLTAIAILASFGIKKHVREYMMAMLALSTGMLGVFISLDFLPVLYVLGIPAGSDVPDHRRLGRTAPYLRGGEVFHLYRCRLPAHAGRASSGFTSIFMKLSACSRPISC